MFNKKNCKRCGKKINQDYDFCPYCGSSETKKEDWGMLGKNDFDMQTGNIKFPLGFNTLFNSLMKDLNKQMNNMDKEINRETNNPQKNPRNSGLSISISTSGNSPPKIKINRFGGEEKITAVKEKKKVFKSKRFSPKQIEKLSKFPKEEPVTEMKRFSEKIVYEINLPDVKSANDISIINLENSIEIKAIGKNKVYTKIIPVNLPIKDYKLSEGRLILELKTE